MDIQIRSAKIEEFELVLNFYKQVGYLGGLCHDDRVVVAMDGGQLVAAGRLSIEKETLVLRGMQVDPEYQRQGIGRVILNQLIDMIDMDCYCIPHRYLENFYKSVGFSGLVDGPAAPTFLTTRLATYIDMGFDVILMKLEKEMIPEFNF